MIGDFCPGCAALMALMVIDGGEAVCAECGAVVRVCSTAAEDDDA